MSAIAELLNECKELNPDTFSGNLLAQAAAELKAYREAVHLLEIVRQKHPGTLRVTYEHPRDRDEQNLRDRIDAVLEELKESEKE